MKPFESRESILQSNEGCYNITAYFNGISSAPFEIRMHFVTDSHLRLLVNNTEDKIFDLAVPAFYESPDTSLFRLRCPELDGALLPNSWSIVRRERAYSLYRQYTLR